MAPPRQPRASEDLLQPPNGNTTRHIHAREKDIIHKTLGNTGVSKSKKVTNPARTPTTTSATIPATTRDGQSTATATGAIPKPIWRIGPGSSEQRMKWSTMSLPTLNKWRTHLSLSISAPFSTESARISLEHMDGIGSHSATMSRSASRRPRPRSDIERALAEAFENRPVDEDEIIAGFLAKGEEEKRITGRNNNGYGSGFASVLSPSSSKPTRCRSDLLS